MCRFMVYKGTDEILLSKLILDPAHSILIQSFDPRLRLDMRRPHNGDGFGIGYYTDPKLGPDPCVFTSTIPAWNCVNLPRLASKTASHLIFAHVRATTEGSLSEDNCHPFCHGSLMFMQNGGVGGWKHVKRRLGEALRDKWYLYVQGGTDSEWAFALFLDTLDRMGHDPSSPPPTGFGPTVLRQAMLETIKRTNDFIAAIPPEVFEQEPIDTRSTLNLALTDGHSVICTRYIRSKTDEAASLYYSSGTSWDDKNRKGEFQMDRKDKGADIVLVSSEPLTFERETWVTVPTNSILTIHKQTVMVHPVIDEFYNRDPYFKRTSEHVQAKGLAAKENGHTPTTPLAVNGKLTKPKVPSSLHESLASSLVPAMRSAPTASPMLSPSQENTPIGDLRHINSNLTASARDPTRPQELGNTKKKRKSLSSRTPSHTMQEEPEPDSPPPRASYGDPLKIAQYFPELDLN